MAAAATKAIAGLRDQVDGPTAIPIAIMIAATPDGRNSPLKNTAQANTPVAMISTSARPLALDGMFAL
jgi:hypothetical protein